jgi:hypothetical protein
LNPDRYDDPAALAWRKLTSIQTAIERVLNAPPGSLPIIDEQTLAAWFEDQTPSGKKARINSKEVNDGQTLENGVA